MFGETVGTILVSSTSTSGYLIGSTVTLVNGTTTNTITSNPPTRIMHITLVSGSGTNSSFQVYNGSAALIPEIIVTGTSGANRITDVDYGMFGQTFPLGAYYKTDANLTQAAVVCKADQF